jgi:hypothetical protein
MLSDLAPNMNDELSSSKPPQRSTAGAPDRNARRFAGPLIIILLGLALYLPGITWGLPGTTSWSQDTIAGIRTLGAAASWPDEWGGRYPPLHYLLLRAAYEPTLRAWRHSGELTDDPDQGGFALAPPHAPKIGRLFLIARVVSVLMAILAGLGIWSAARALTGDRFAAGVAALSLMIGAAFTYFAHLGNVDVPSICWFAWSVYFYIRVLQSPHWKYCVLLGLFGSLAISTKDGLAGVYPGMAVMLLVAETHRRLADRTPGRAFLSALLQPKWLVGLATFALPYLLINGIFFDPDPYLTRMRYWLDSSSDTLHARQFRHPSQLHLLFVTVRYGAGAVGWPMLAAMAAAALYTLRKRTRIALALLVPALSYYLIIIAPMGFVYSRFLFAPLALAGILLGVATAALWRNGRVDEYVRWGLPAVVFALSIGYAVSVDLEMIEDSRYVAEGWFQEHVAPPSSIGAFTAFEQMPFKPHYLPRVHELGYATGVGPMSIESFGGSTFEYLILTSYNYDDFDEQETECMDRLLDGQLGYTPVAIYGSHYLNRSENWLGLAGWGAPTPGKISPTIIILKREEP